MTDGEPLLRIRDLHVEFSTRPGTVRAVRGLDLDLWPGRVKGIVGESGAGKSVAMMSVLGLLPPTATVTGSARFRGRELLGLGSAELRSLRGADIAMVFQDPMTSLNPVLTVGHQLTEAMRAHKVMSRKASLARAVELLELVSIPQPSRRVRAYPHELSGGMRQRVMIAMAVANDPDLLIADEPTTALDVTIQAQILEVLSTIQRERGLAIVLITHDLGVVAGMADDVVVMYAGRAVERGAVDDVFYRSNHPYTRGLLGCLPSLHRRGTSALGSIGGTPPSLIDLPSGCPFHPRCPLVEPDCLVIEPALTAVRETEAACLVTTRA